MKIDSAIVTGGAGFIGSHLIDKLLEQNVDKILIIESIVEFFRPEYLKISISLFSNNLIKNNCIVMSKIKGNISNINDGEFRKDKKSVKLIDNSKILLVIENHQDLNSSEIINIKS